MNSPNTEMRNEIVLRSFKHGNYLEVSESIEHQLEPERGLTESLYV